MEEKYRCERPREMLVLEPEDWSEGEWVTILKLFGMRKAERIVISEYKLETYGVPTDRVIEEIEP